MKTKLLALIMAILCFVTVFAACGKKCEEHVDSDGDAVCDNCGEAVAAESEPENDTEDVCNHVDTDADKVCDNCKKAIVAIVEQLPAETEAIVDMIVNKIPTDAKLADFLNVTAETAKKVIDVEKIENYSAMRGSVVLTRANVEGVNTYAVKDLDTNKVIVTKTDVVSETSETRYTITLGNRWYVVETVKKAVEPGYTYLTETSRSYDVYTFSGEQIGDTFVYDGITTFEEPVLDGSYDPTVDYVTYGGNTYAISDETNEIVYTCMTETLVKRPVMDCVVDNYGYVIEDNDDSDVSINVYDLNEWIKCVYTYDVPEGVSYANISVISGGDIFVSYCKPLSGKAVNYDIIDTENGMKYDMVYTVVDVETFEAKELEFGYFVNGIFEIGDDESVTDAAKEYNLVNVHKIVEGRVDSDMSIFIVDNELNIVCDLTFIYGAEAVGDGILARTVRFNDGTNAKELVKVDGTHIDYVPYESRFAYGYRVLGNRIFDLSGNLVLDLTDATIHGDGIDDFIDHGYVIYSERVEGKAVYKLFNATGATVEVKNDKTDWVLTETHRSGYVVTYKEERNENGAVITADVYEFFNNAGESVLKTDSYINVGYEYIITVAGEAYIVK